MQTETSTASPSSKRHHRATSDIVVGKLDQAVMRRYIQERNIDIDVAAPAIEIANALVVHAFETTAKSELSSCSDCRGISAWDLPMCPYCGAAGEAEEAATQAADEDGEEQDAEKAPAPPLPPIGDPEEDEQNEAGDDGENEDGDDELVPVKTAPAAKKTAAGQKAKTAKGAKAMSMQQTNGVGHKTNGTTALERPVTVRQLDEHVANVLRLKSDGAENYWRIGRELIAITTSHAWTMRVRDGKQAYKTFEQMCVAELKISPQVAYQMKEIAKEYETPEEVRALGTTKASLILKAAPEDRDELKEKARAGTTTRELSKDVKKSRAKHGPTKTSQQALAGAKGAAKTNAASANEKITVAALEGSKTIKLLKKPETMRGADWSVLKRAKSLKDLPIGRLVLAHGVTQTFTIVTSEEGLSLKIETRRESSEK